MRYLHISPSVIMLSTCRVTQYRAFLVRIRAIGSGDEYVIRPGLVDVESP